jgi:aspartate kinase
MAAYLQADACEIYTDVDGVFTADPRVVPEARKLDEVSFEEMAEMAAAGAGVLMLRSVELGWRQGVPLHVRSSFHYDPGTWVREAISGPAVLAGVAHDPDSTLVGLAGGIDPGMVAAALQTAGVPADTVGMGPAGAGAAVPGDQAAAAVAALAATGGTGAVTLDEEVGKVSLVGAALRSRSQAAAEVPALLKGGGIPVLLTAATQLRVSCLVPSGRLDEAVRLLHRTFFPSREEAS